MRRRIVRVAVRVCLAALAAGVTGCHLVFPCESRTEQVSQPYWFAAELYRQLPGTNEEFTEWWFTYGWPEGQYANDPWGYLTWKCGEYIDTSVTPNLGMVWRMRNLQYVAVPYRELAVDCSDPSYLPHSFGGPYGAALRWNNPPGSEASVSISLTDKNGAYRHADPAVKTASIDVAERTGMPDWSSGGAYIRGKQHIRFADMFFELATPFQLGSDITVNKCYLQSIGTVVAERVGTTYEYTIYPGNSKFFFYGNATQGGDNGTTSFCFANSITQNVTLNQQGPYTYFALALNLPSNVLGQNMTIQIGLSKPYSQPSLFAGHQPVVTLLDKQADGPEVDLAPDDVVDLDGDLGKLMWFENFEATNEAFLGTGRPLHVTFTPGSHEVALVAYDARGAYGTGIMTLTVPPPPANDACSSATVITDGQYSGTLLGAARDGSASCGGNGQPNTQADAWYRYTASAGGTLHVNTCGTNDLGGVDAGMDSVLSLHSGCPGTTANELICNDDAPNGNDPTACASTDASTHRDSAVALPVTAGQTVLIRVSRYYNSRSGPFLLNVRLDITPPPNDACANATQIQPGWCLGTLVGATNDGSTSCGSSGSLNQPDAWYRYTAPQAGTLKVSTCGTNDWGGPDRGMDTVLSVHSGCPGTNANQLACNDDWTSGNDPSACNGVWPLTDVGLARDSSLSVPVMAGQNVLIRVSKYGANSPGTFYVTLGLQSGTPGDFDGDGDVDLADFLHFQGCFNGPNKPYAASGCVNADLDHDNDVDLADFLIFQDCFNGPSRPPACP